MRSSLLTPTLIPFKRFTSTIIAIILASAIFSGTILTIQSLSSQSTNFFDQRSNTVIIYDTTVNTPFTSKVDINLVKSIKVLPGINAYSEEVLQPAIINGKPSFYRGVNLTNIVKFDPTFKIYGNSSTIFQINTTQTVVGDFLKDRFNINIGDIISVSSTISGKFVNLEVIGFVDTEMPYKFEALTSLETSQFLANYFSTVTHIQVNFDDTITSKSEILKQLTRKHELKVNVQFENGTDDKSLVNLQIFDSEETLLVSGSANISQTYFLPTGFYKIQLEKLGTILDSKKIVLYEDQIIQLSTNEHIYKVFFNFTYKGFKYGEIPYTLYSSNFELINNGTLTNSSLNFLLETGNYSLRLNTGIKPFFLNFSVMSSINRTFDIAGNFTKVKFNLPQNAVLLNNISSLYVDGLLDYYQVFLYDKSGGNFTENIEIDYENGLIELNLTNGFYLLVINDPKIEGNSTVGRLNFQVNTNTTTLQTDLIDGKRYEVGSTFILNTTAINLQTLQIKANQYTLKIDNSTGQLASVKLPEQRGIYSLTISGKDFLGKIWTKSFKIILDNRTELAGWMLPEPIPKVLEGVQYPIWYSGEILSISENWSINIIKSGYAKLKMEGTTNENQLVLTLSEGTQILSFEFISNISKIIQITNSSGTEFGLETNEIHSSDLRITFNEHDYAVVLTINGERFEVNPSFPYQIPNVLSTASLEIFQIVGTENVLIKTVNWNVIDDNAIPDLPIPHFLFANSTSTGIFRLDGYKYVFTFENGTEFIPANISDSKIILPSGKYRISVFMNSQSFNFTLDVKKFENTFAKTMVENGILKFSWGYLQVNKTDEISITEGTYRIGDNIFFNDPTLDHLSGLSSKITNQSQWTIVISGFRYLKYTKIFENNTSVTSIYDKKIELKSNKNERINIYLIGIDKFGNQFSNTFFVILNQPTVKFLISVYTRDYTAFPQFGISFDINVQFYGVSSANITQNNTEIELVQGKITISSLKSLDIDLPFDFNVNDTSHTIKIFINNPFVTILTYNANNNITKPYKGLLIIRDLISGKVLVNDISELEQFELPASTYDIQIFNEEQTTNKTLNLQFSSQLLITLPIFNQTIYLETIKIGNFYIKSVTAEHGILGVVSNGIVVSKDNSFEKWVVFNFPYGDLNIRIELSNGEVVNVNFVTEAKESMTIKTILDFSGLNDQYIDESLLNKGAININVGLIESTGYIETFLGNLITLVRIVFLAELLIISFILVINIIHTIEFFVKLSKREIRTLLTIGHSKRTSIFLISRGLILTIAIYAMIGYSLGYFLISTFVRVNRITLFGHDLIFEFWNLEAIVSNLIGVIVMVFVSIIAEIKRIRPEDLTGF